MTLLEFFAMDETPFSGGGEGGDADAYEPDDPEEYVI